MNSEKAAEDILKSHNLRRTQIRLEILQLFMKQEHALSVNDLEKMVTASHDRVTLYRALNSFEENGILHQTPDKGGNMRYALCAEGCSGHEHKDEHAHFICEECKQTFCLQEVKVPDVQLSGDYQLNSVSYTMSGVCKECQ